MHIAYATTYDAHDVHKWSGLGKYIACALESADLDLHYVNVGEIPVAARAAGKISAMTIRRRIDPEREPYFATRWALSLSRALGSDTDVVFSPSTLPLAYLDVDVPRVFWTDATFASLVDFYPRFSRLHPRTLRNGHTVEQKAIETSSAAIYSSDWAAASAIRDYGADPAKVHVLPFGANLARRPEAGDIDQLLSLRVSGPCRLLFVGTEWERKGGPIALKTAQLLNAAGIETELTVIGTPIADSTEPGVRSLGFVSKEADPETFRSAYERAHFLIVPSRAEAAGVVYAEASAFGVPSIATDVGGVSTMVRDGVNGRLFSVEAGPEAYAEFIASALPRYEELARRAFADYRDRLDWNVNGRRAAAILERIAR
jgi:glycosyltransferase involved in cell wall biosynthesis